MKGSRTHGSKLERQKIRGSMFCVKRLRKKKGIEKKKKKPKGTVKKSSWGSRDRRTKEETEIG